MRWKAYIAKRIGKTTEYESEVKEFDLDDTTPADMRTAIIHASKLYHVFPSGNLRENKS